MTDASESLRPTRDPARMLGEALGLLRELEATIAQAPSAPASDDASALLAGLRSFTRQVLAEQSVVGVAERALAEILELGLARHAFLSVRDAAGAPLERFVSLDAGDLERLELRGVARTALARVVAWQEPLFLPSMAEDAQLGAEAETYGVSIGGVIALPLSIEGEVVGGLYLDRASDDPRYRETELDRARHLAELLARCLGMALRDEQRSRREEHLASLFGLARSVGNGLELEGMLDHVAATTLQITGAERAFILLIEGDQLAFGVGRDRESSLPSNTLKQLSQSVCQKVLETQTQVCVFDAGADQEFGMRRSVLNLQLQGIVAVPLFGRMGISGVLYIDSKTKALAALRKEMTVLTAIASVAGLMIDNARLFHRATVDPATGLFTHSLLMIRLEEEVTRARRYKRPFSLVLVDLDEGRDAGEAAMKRVAAVVRAQLRAGIDFPAVVQQGRIAMILPETDGDGALVVAERIRVRVASEGGSGTVSIGIAPYPAASTSMHGLLEAAERAIASAQGQGRNRTVVGAPS